MYQQIWAGMKQQQQPLGQQLPHWAASTISLFATSSTANIQLLHFHSAYRPYCLCSDFGQTEHQQTESPHLHEISVGSLT